jgi:prepilin peptidase CpaA
MDPAAPMTLSALPLIFPALMAFAASYDTLSMRIGNGLCLALVLAFVPAALLQGLTGPALVMHVSCALAMLAAGFALYAMGWVGGGDAKLFAAAALWLGWTHISTFAALTAIAGGVLAAIFIAWRLLRLRFWPYRRGEVPAVEMPYGIALASAALLTYPHTVWTAGL